MKQVTAEDTFEAARERLTEVGTARAELPLVLLRDNVYVEIEEELPSHIIIQPEAYKDLPVRGRVLAVGPGRISSMGVLIPGDAQVGDLIQFHFGGVAMHYPDKKHAVVEAKFIQAILG